MLNSSWRNSLRNLRRIKLHAEAEPELSGSAVLRRLRSRNRTDWNRGQRRAPRSSQCTGAPHSDAARRKLLRDEPDRSPALLSGSWSQCASRIGELGAHHEPGRSAWTRSSASLPWFRGSRREVQAGADRRVQRDGVARGESTITRP